MPTSNIYETTNITKKIMYHSIIKKLFSTSLKLGSKGKVQALLTDILWSHIHNTSIKKNEYWERHTQNKGENIVKIILERGKKYAGHI